MSADLDKLNAKLDAEIAGAKALTAFRTNDVTTFGPDPESLALASMEQAHALSIIISNIFDAPRDERVARDIHLARAIDTITLLTALAAFAQQGADA